MRAGVVIIGRNEGLRLRRCLESVQAQCPGPIVYVDSASTDNSVEIAANLGVETIRLSARLPLNAARARNIGFSHILRTHPRTEAVQFVDGDSELEPHWMEAGWTFLDTHPCSAIVVGVLRERHPDVSLYNRLCDLEWRGPIGKIDSCGGLCMVRAAAFREVHGFCEEMIAGEEPELCLRLRTACWDIYRIEQPMAIHDASMERLHQWWTRGVRAGHAYAEGHRRHAGGTMVFWRREVGSILFYGGAIPALILALITIFGPMMMAFMVAASLHAK